MYLNAAPSDAVQGVGFWGAFASGLSGAAAQSGASVGTSLATTLGRVAGSVATAAVGIGVNKLVSSGGSGGGGGGGKKNKLQLEQLTAENAALQSRLSVPVNPSVSPAGTAFPWGTVALAAGGVTLLYVLLRRL